MLHLDDDGDICWYDRYGQRVRYHTPGPPPGLPPSSAHRGASILEALGKVCAFIWMVMVCAFLCLLCALLAGWHW